MNSAHWQRRAEAGIAASLAQTPVWDVLVIGGGINGAGIALEAARRGLTVLLAEQKDFAWGTSSRSSKLVHGGLRYLKQGQLQLTRDSVRERDALMSAAAGLVEPQSFAFAHYQGRAPGRWMFALGLAVYDCLSGKPAQHYFPRDEFLMLSPHIGTDSLQGGMCYTDAKTDDARLVLRVLQEAQQHGAMAVNYLKVESLCREEGSVCGAVLRDQLSQQTMKVNARLVVNASGVWAGGWQNKSAPEHKLRPLRGSHLLFPQWRLPVAQAVSLMHPRDGRPVFLYPWEGATLVGTTDVDHTAATDLEPQITGAEVSYLMEALDLQFPELRLQAEDIISTYAGVRPVLDSGQSDPSKESRDHAIWIEDGMISVTGGKLTTFRLMAQEVLRQAASLLPALVSRQAKCGQPLFAPSAAILPAGRLRYAQQRRLLGRYGAHAAALVNAAQADELTLIPGTDTLWAELRWAAANEAVVHLDDLLLRRTRIGLLRRHGASECMERIRQICQPLLGWSDQFWDNEAERYLALIRQCYSLPAAEQIPSWRGVVQTGA